MTNTDTRDMPEIRLLDDSERPPATADKLNLRFQEVSGHHNLDIYYSRNKSIGRALQHFAKHIGGEVHHFRFIFDGERLDGEKTPSEVCTTTSRQKGGLTCCEL